MVFQRRCPRADPRVLFRTLLYVLRVWRALTSGWSCTPPCRVCSHSRASLGTPRRWSLSLEGLHAAPFVGLCSALFPRDRPRWFSLPSRPCAGGHPMSPLCTSLLSLSTFVWGDRGSLPWSGFPLLRPPGCSPAEAQSLRLFAAVAAAAVYLVVSGHSSTQTCSN